MESLVEKGKSIAEELISNIDEETRGIEEKSYVNGDIEVVVEYTARREVIKYHPGDYLTPPYTEGRFVINIRSVKVYDLENETEEDITSLFDNQIEWNYD